MNSKAYFVGMAGVAAATISAHFGSYEFAVMFSLFALRNWIDGAVDAINLKDLVEVEVESEK